MKHSLPFQQETPAKPQMHPKKLRNYLDNWDIYEEVVLNEDA